MNSLQLAIIFLCFLSNFRDSRLWTLRLLHSIYLQLSPPLTLSFQSFLVNTFLFNVYLNIQTFRTMNSLGFLLTSSYFPLKLSYFCFMNFLEFDELSYFQFLNFQFVIVFLNYHFFVREYFPPVCYAMNLYFFSWQTV